MATKVRVEGLKELDAALAQLPKALAKGVLKRVLTKAGQPIAEAARRNVPVRTGHLRDSIIVGTKIVNTTGKAEYAQAMQAGLGKAAAVSALRDARRTASADASFAEVFVGPGRLPYAHLVEFGSVHNTPHPYLRPAWDAEKGGALEIVKRELGGEIAKTAARLAKRQAKAAAGG